MLATVERNLVALLEAHGAAYDELQAVADRTEYEDLDRTPDWSRADETERKALLNICRYRPVSEEERRQKAEYLLALAEHASLPEDLGLILLHAEASDSI